MIQKILKSFKLIKSGDWLIIAIFAMLIISSAKLLWNLPQGKYLEIYKKNEILTTYSLNQELKKQIHGPKGVTEVIISKGKVRFASSPCPKKYCIHQGWINKANQTIICIPNQISISIVGPKSGYDSINY